MLVKPAEELEKLKELKKLLQKRYVTKEARTLVEELVQNAQSRLLGPDSELPEFPGKEKLTDRQL